MAWGTATCSGVTDGEWKVGFVVRDGELVCPEGAMGRCGMSLAIVVMGGGLMTGVYLRRNFLLRRSE